MLITEKVITEKICLKPKKAFYRSYNKYCYFEEKGEGGHYWF